MLKIPLSQHKLRILANHHANQLLPLVKLRLEEADTSFLKSYFSTDLLIKGLLKCSALGLKKLNDKILAHLNKEFPGVDVEPAIKSVFSYTYFASKTKPDYNAFNLCRSLDLFTCPYCNVVTITTLYSQENEENLLRPPLDHFYCASHFPLLAMSFYNLVPACAPCNTTHKKDQVIGTDTHLHPYIGGFEEKCAFRFAGYDDIDDLLAADPTSSFDLLIENQTTDVRYDGNVALFKLDPTYQKHIEFARETLEKVKIYSLADLESTKHLLGLTKVPGYQFIFGTKYQLDNLHERPFSKFTRDVTLKYCSKELKTALQMT